LASVLREFGITPVQIWRDGRNRRGYHLDTITNALNTQGEKPT
jgi:hypothetical protein